jgi:hypothetical protein
VGLPAWDRRTRRLLFLDLKTTGLAGGAGHAFLVECGWFGGTGFPRGGSSRRSANEVARIGGRPRRYRRVRGDHNGRTFLMCQSLETRCVHRLPTPFDGLPHVDMLHGRRLWREATPNAA